eukprot:CAMPEP_0174736482 /NCGR_PEP_ID=MMETSP1094-20130205/66740_1 /TAXON_ID=156173 /ORGANISM="Chrysochromulina brevifilum, Strain UTEX LB 985" /LENGTH=189 /DNA_ID=CAMNT_0015939585 /DNA_START=43 /DNA_END=612 /DNA_ORIENTATION=+
MDATDALQEVSSRLLTDALTCILKRIHESDDVREFLDACSESFADFSAAGEQRLEWTEMHNEYIAIVEDILTSELQVLGCPEATLIDHVMHSDDPLTKTLLARLLAKTDYEQFCAMMQAESGAAAFARRWTDDDPNEYPAVEVEDDGEVLQDGEALEAVETLVAAMRVAEPEVAPPPDLQSLANPRRRW